MSIQILGWKVKGETSLNGRTQVKELSRLYLAKEAAERFMELAKKERKWDKVWVSEVLGVDDLP